MVKARDIMRKEVITVSPETSVEDLGRMFIDNDISGAPVIDENGELYGIVTENDLISRNKKFHIPTVLRIFDALIPLESTSSVEKEIRKMTASKVGEICSRDVVTIDGETTLAEMATLMSEKKIHLLPVVEGKKIVGIVGKKELIRSVSGAT
ncbi:hypoxic response protein 1 [bacterium BMS3Abin07]|nr:hypoxic response protein 1 [bacterium BMS3Abin07]GBE32993.1 hypoxic response protein 1 [bacterium BMS3Bbin05]